MAATQRRRRLLAPRLLLLAATTALLLLFSPSLVLAQDENDCSLCGKRGGNCVHAHDPAAESPEHHIKCSLCGAIGMCHFNHAHGAVDERRAQFQARERDREMQDEKERAEAAKEKRDKMLERQKERLKNAMAKDKEEEEGTASLPSVARAMARATASSLTPSPPRGGRRSLMDEVSITEEDCRLHCGANGAGDCVHVAGLDRLDDKRAVDCFVCSYLGICPHDLRDRCPEGEEDLCERDRRRRGRAEEAGRWLRR